MTFSDIFRVFIKPEQVNAEELLGMAGMADRNSVRLQAIKEEMGEKYILHPIHTKSRLNTPRPV